MKYFNDTKIIIPAQGFQNGLCPVLSTFRSIATIQTTLVKYRLAVWLAGKLNTRYVNWRLYFNIVIIVHDFNKAKRSIVMIHVDVEGNWDTRLLTGEMTWTVAVTPPLHPHHWPGRIRIIMRYRPGGVRQGWIKTWTMINVLLIIVARHWCVYERHNYWLPNIASVHSYCRKCISISLCYIERTILINIIEISIILHPAPIYFIFLLW